MIYLDVSVFVNTRNSLTNAVYPICVPPSMSRSTPFKIALKVSVSFYKKTQNTQHLTLMILILKVI